MVSSISYLCNASNYIKIFCKAAGNTHGDGIADGEVDENISRVILFEDISEFLFSLTSEEARLSLLYQFIDFFGGKISQWLVISFQFRVMFTLLVQTVHSFI